MRSIAIVSGKGGVGKTTAAINIAHVMSKHDGRTVLVDADLSTPNVHIYLGWPVLRKNLISALHNQHSLSEAIYKHESGLRVLPSISSVSDINRLKHEKLRAVVNSLQEDNAVILLDCASGVGKEAVSAMEACDEILVVVNPHLPSVIDAQKTIQVGHELGKLILGVVINQVTPSKNELSVREVERLLDLPVIGVIPFDEAISKANKMKHPLTHIFPRSKAGKEYILLSEMLLGRKYMRSILQKKTMKDYILEKLGFA